MRAAWKSVSMRAFTEIADHKPTIGRPFHHLGLLKRSDYVTGFFYWLKALNVDAPFLPTQSSLFIILGQFVAPENQTTGTRSQVLSRDEELFFTAVTLLVLASVDPGYLEKEGYGTDRSTYLGRFDRTLAMVTGGDEESDPSRGALAAAPLPTDRQTDGVPLARSPTSGPASHYLKPMCGKAVDGASSDAAQEGGAESKEAVSEPAEVPGEAAQSYAVRPRYAAPPPTPLTS